MSQNYHYRKGAMTLGPYKLDEMRRLAQQGQIGRSHQISIDGGQSWQTGSDVPEIFAKPSTTREATDRGEGGDGGPSIPRAGKVEWHYTLGGVQQDTPVSEDELRQLVRLGRVSGEDRVWTATLGDWTVVRALPMLAQELPPVHIETAGKPKRRRRKNGSVKSAGADDQQDKGINAAGMSGFICSIVAVVLLAIPCLVWVLIAQSFFWIFNTVIPLSVLALLGLVLSVIGLSKPGRRLATAGTVLGVIAVSMSVMAIVGSATIRYRMATLRRTQIDGRATDIELVRKQLDESLSLFRNLRSQPDEDEELFRLRQKRALQDVGMHLGNLVEHYHDHLEATSMTSEFRSAFETGLPQLRSTVITVQQAAKLAELTLPDVLQGGMADMQLLKLLDDTLTLYQTGKITIGQAEAKMAGQ